MCPDPKSYTLKTGRFVYYTPGKCLDPLAGTVYDKIRNFGIKNNAPNYVVKKLRKKLKEINKRRKHRGSNRKRDRRVRK